MKTASIAAITLAIVVLLATTAPTPALGAFDAFVQFGAPTDPSMAVSGESTDLAFRGAIEIKEFSFGSENTVSIGSATGGAGAGKATLKSLVITKWVDKASPSLFRALATGGHYPSLTLSIRKASGVPTASGSKPYLVLTFQMVFVSRIDTAGSSGDEVPWETVTLSYGAMKIQYSTQDPTGQLTPMKPVIWNQIQNSATELVTTP